jgi:hypothetical protein
VLIVAVTAAIWFVLSPHEPPMPVYEGRTLRQWLEEYSYYVTPDTRYNPSRYPLGQSDAEKAVHQIGTNALPTLLSMAGHRYWFFYHLKLERMAKEYLKLKRSPAVADHELARNGFKILGPIAKPSVPALIRLMDDRDFTVQITAIECLAYIGPDSEPAIPQLLQRLQQSNSVNVLQWSATWALGAIHRRPNLVLSCLVGNLNSTNSLPGLGNVLRHNSIQAVAEYGPQAKSAVPALLPFLESPDLGTRKHASNALARIRGQ